MKAELPIVEIPSFKESSDRDEHSLNIVSGILLRPDGRFTITRLLHPLNNAVPRFKAFSGSEMLSKDLASRKQSYPISVRLVGKVTEASLRLPKNTLCPKDLTPSGIFMEVSDVMSLKKL